MVAPLSTLQPVPSQLPIGVDSLAGDAQGERFFASEFGYPPGGDEVVNVSSFVPGGATYETAISVPSIPTASVLELSLSPERVCVLRGDAVVCQKRADGTVQTGPSLPIRHARIAHTTKAVYGMAQPDGFGAKAKLTRWAFDSQLVTTALPECQRLGTAGDTAWAQDYAGKLFVGHEGTAGFAEVAAELPAGTTLYSLAFRERDLFALGASGPATTLYRVAETGITEVAREGLCENAQQLSLSGDSLIWVCPGETIVRAPLVP